MSLFGPSKREMVRRDEALPGRAQPMAVTVRHAVLGTALAPPFPVACQSVLFGMGCFWGAEKLFWPLAGVHVTAVGYAGGFTPNPTYEEVCTARTGHAEVVLVVYDPAVLAFATLLRVFWEGHDPTQGMRQGHDVGTQYRSAIYVEDQARQHQAEASRESYAPLLAARGFGPITTEIAGLPTFYWAEDYHQQYLARNPGGYCGLGGTGVRCGY